MRNPNLAGLLVAPGLPLLTLFCSVPSALHNVVADRVADEVRDGMKAELLHDVGSVGFHRFHADLKNVGDLFIGFAFGHQFDDLRVPVS